MSNAARDQFVLAGGCLASLLLAANSYICTLHQPFRTEESGRTTLKAPLRFRTLGLPIPCPDQIALTLSSP